MKLTLIDLTKTSSLDTNDNLKGMYDSTTKINYWISLTLIWLSELNESVILIIQSLNVTTFLKPPALHFVENS